MAINHNSTQEQVKIFSYKWDIEHLSGFIGVKTKVYLWLKATYFVYKLAINIAKKYHKFINKIYVINLLNLQCLRQYLNESKSVGQTEISQKYSN